MLFPGAMCAYNFTYDNWGANPSNTPGTSVTPGASNVEGSWTQIASSANIAQDCYWLMLNMLGSSSSTNDKSQILDVGVDPAGGTSYTQVIANIVCGMRQAASGAAFSAFLFPFFIKSGSSVAVRIQGSNATAGTVRVCGKFYGQPTNPLATPVGAISQTFGTITNSGGQSFTPGNAADGSWVDLGATTTALWWWQLGWQVSNGTVTAEGTYIDLAWGDASNKHIIRRMFHYGTTSENMIDVMGNMPAAVDSYAPVPAGANIYIRGRCANAPDTGYNATVIGIGG